MHSDLRAADTTSDRLAAFIAASQPEDLPECVVHEAKRTLLNAFGAALGGWTDPAGERMLSLLRGLSGPATAGIIGRKARLDILQAAFLNALNINVLDFDDTHLPTVIHPAAPIVPPLLALAQQGRIHGRALLHAVALGVEVACRLGNAVHPGHYRRGWHITASCGVVGAAAASASLLQLSADEIGHAIGTAASQSAGLVENLPYEAKNVQIGNSARNGLFAALTAQIGYRAASSTIEGPGGWARATGGEIDRGALLDGLGQSWELNRNTYKAYPCGIVLAPVIDACLAIRADKAVDPARVAEVVVRGHPLLLERADRPQVLNERTAKLSIQHAAAVALLLGAAGLEQFGAAAVAHPAVTALRQRVRAEPDLDAAVEEAFVAVRLKDGRSVERAIKAARGSEKCPLTDTEIETKLRELARLGSPLVEVDRLIEAVWTLDRAEDAGKIVSLSQPRVA